MTNCTVTEIRKESCHAVESLLSHEPINNVTVECVEMICQRIEKKNFEVYSDIIDTLSALPLVYLEPPQDDYKEEKTKPIKVMYICILFKYILFLYIGLMTI